MNPADRLIEQIMHDLEQLDVIRSSLDTADIVVSHFLDLLLQKAAFFRSLRAERDIHDRMVLLDSSSVTTLKLPKIACHRSLLHRKSVLKAYLEQISFIISDREKLPYTEEGEYAGRNALWFSQLQILQMRLDYLLDN